MYSLLFYSLFGFVVTDSIITNFSDPHNKTSFKYVDTDNPIDPKACEDTCLAKCCPGTLIMLQNEFNITCVENVYGVTKLQDTPVDIYSQDYKMKTHKTLKEFTFVYKNNDFNDFLGFDKFEGDMRLLRLYLLETGSIVWRSPNRAEQWSSPATYDKFCVDAQIDVSDNGTATAANARLVYMLELSEFEYTIDEFPMYGIQIVKPTLMLISCVLVLLVLIVYAVLPQKRNLTSLVLMAYVAGLTGEFLSQALQLLTANMLDKPSCIVLGLTAYYTTLSSFTWMNVISYNIWSKTSKSRQPRWKPQRRILVQFWWCSVYGFGVPLLMTLFLVSIDFIDLSSLPDFIQPHFVGDPDMCYLSDGEEKMYEYVPLLITTVINILFFIVTAKFIWGTTVKSESNGESRNTKKDQRRFLVYLKLTLIMGCNRILPVGLHFTKWHSDPHWQPWIWYFLSILNCSVSAFIFYTFVCKKEMLVLLCKRFSIKISPIEKLEPLADIEKFNEYDIRTDNQTNRF